MSRIVWFALGTFAGMAYATRVIRTENLDLAPGQVRQSPMERNKVDLKTRLSTMIDEQSRKLATMILEQGQSLASKLRGEEEGELGPVVLIEEIDVFEPIETPEMAGIGQKGTAQSTGQSGGLGAMGTAGAGSEGSLGGDFGTRGPTGTTGTTGGQGPTGTKGTSSGSTGQTAGDLGLENNR
jgi:hypothetical protein